MRRYIIAAAFAIPLLGFLFLATGYASDEMIGTERVSRGVTAAGIRSNRETSRGRGRCRKAGTSSAATTSRSATRKCSSSSMDWNTKVAAGACGW